MKRIKETFDNHGLMELAKYDGYIIVPVSTVWGVLIVIGILSVCRLLYVDPEGTDVGGLIPPALPTEPFATAFNDV